MLKHSKNLINVTVIAKELTAYYFPFIEKALSKLNQEYSGWETMDIRFIFSKAGTHEHLRDRIIQNGGRFGTVFSLKDVVNVPDNLLKKDLAARLFSGIHLSPEDPTPKSSGYFFATDKTPTRTLTGYIGFSTPHIIHALLQRNSYTVSEWPRFVKDLKQALYMTISHELHHAADWAYQQAAKGLDKNILLRPTDSPNKDKETSDWDREAYYNESSEVMSYALNAAQVLLETDSAENLVRLDGQSLVQLLRKDPEINKALNHMTSTNRKLFFQRVHGFLQSEALENQTVHTSNKHRICKQCSAQHKQAARRIFWHGTSSKHLRSILKQGLLPDKTKAVYDIELDDNNIGGTRSIKTYGGVYLTEDFRTAYSASGTAILKTKGNRLIVAVTYEERTPGTLIDEDSIIINMSYLGQSGTRRAEDLFRGPGFWPNNVGLYEYKSYYGSVSFNISRIPAIVDAINNADLTEYSKMFIDKLIKDWPKLQNRYDTQPHKMERLFSRMLKCYAFHLMEVELKLELTEVKNGILKNIAELETYNYTEEQKQERRDKYEHTLDTLDNLPPELTSTWSKLRDAVDMLSSFAKELTERPGRATDELRFDHIRAKETISFSGKNKILFIAEIDEHRTDAGFVSEVIVHWGKEHLKLFVDKYSQAWGPNFKVVDRQGTILKNSAKKEITNFPQKGDDLEISLRNSNYPQADYEYCLDLKDNYPEIWSKGGNVYGNTAFNFWTKYRKGIRTEGVLGWIKEREAWFARHYNNKLVAGVVAWLKWGGYGQLGESGVKDLLAQEKSKLNDK